MSKFALASIFLLLVLQAIQAVPPPEYAAQPFRLRPTDETGPAGVDGDDPAIWVSSKDTGQSVIITTAKTGDLAGLNVFDLSGKFIQYVPAGRPNNVDVVYDLPFGNEKIDLAVAACRTDNTICMWRIDDTGRLQEIPGGSQATVPGFSVYGSCEYKSPKDGKQYVFVNSKTSEYLQFEIFAQDGSLRSKLVRRFNGGSGGQTEGCVGDKDNGWIFVGEEDKGFWRYDAEPEGSNDGILVDHVDVANGGHLQPDVEGITLYYGKDKTDGYLLVSVQGISGFNVYERAAPHRFLFTFTLEANPSKGIDAVQEPDGLAVVSTGLGKLYPQGMLVVHDDHKELPDGTIAPETTFKMVDFGQIASAPAQKLKVFPYWDPRPCPKKFVPINDLTAG